MIIETLDCYKKIYNYYFKDRSNTTVASFNQEQHLYCDPDLTYQEYCLIRNVEINIVLCNYSFDTDEMYSLEFEYKHFCLASLYNKIIIDKPWDEVLIDRTKLSVGKEPLEELNWQYRSPYKEILEEKGIVFPKSSRLHSICCDYYRMVDDYNFDLDPDLTYEEYEIIRQMRYDTNNKDGTISLYNMHSCLREWMKETVAHFDRPALFTKPFLDAIVDKSKVEFKQINNFKELEPYKTKSIEQNKYKEEIFKKKLFLMYLIFPLSEE